MLVVPLCLLSIAGVGVAVRERSLQQRIEDGECSADQPDRGGTFFPLDKRAREGEPGAELFSIAYGPTFKVVVSDIAKEQYVLTQCGQTAPKEEEVDSLVAKGEYTRKHFQVPLQSAAASSTIVLGLMRALDVYDRIDFLSAYASGSCWQKALSCGAALESSFGNITLLKEQLTSVDAVFMSCGADGDCSNVHSQTNGVHVPTAQEKSPLRSAEYVKFIAAFFNLEPQANKAFQELKAAYTEAFVVQDPKPVVAWIAYSDYAKAFEVSEATYKKVMSEDAGGAMWKAAEALAGVSEVVRTEKSSGVTYSLPLSAFDDNKEAAAASLTGALANVDVIVDETYHPNPFTYTLDSFLDNFGLSNASTLRFLDSNKVLRYDGRVSESYGWDWFESRIARPDWAVTGLARGMHGDLSKTFKYFRNIAEDEQAQILSPSLCNDSLPICGEGVVKPIPLQGNGKGPVNFAWVIGGIVAVVVLAAVILGVLCISCRTGETASEAKDSEIPLQEQS